MAACRRTAWPISSRSCCFDGERGSGAGGPCGAADRREPGRGRHSTRPGAPLSATARKSPSSSASWYNRSGGAERIYCELANMLTARGYEVTCLHYDAVPGKPFFAIDRRVEVINLYPEFRAAPPSHGALALAAFLRAAVDPRDVGMVLDSTTSSSPSSATTSLLRKPDCRAHLHAAGQHAGPPRRGGNRHQGRADEPQRPARGLHLAGAVGSQSHRPQDAACGARPRRPDSRHLPALRGLVSRTISARASSRCPTTSRGYPARNAARRCASRIFSLSGDLRV